VRAFVRNAKQTKFRGAWHHGTAGAQRIFIWPVADEERQLELFMERVARA